MSTAIRVATVYGRFILLHVRDEVGSAIDHWLPYTAILGVHTDPNRRRLADGYDTLVMVRGGPDLQSGGWAPLLRVRESPEVIMRRIIAAYTDREPWYE